MLLTGPVKTFRDFVVHVPVKSGSTCAAARDAIVAPPSSRVLRLIIMDQKREEMLKKGAFIVPVLHPFTVKMNLIRFRHNPSMQLNPELKSDKLHTTVFMFNVNRLLGQL